MAAQIPALAFEGAPIAERGEILSLTDMWKAASSLEGRRPANWARKEGAEFIGFLREALNVPVGHIYSAARGAGGATFAHWQIALAYAKYLSPAFHAWCNTVVRARMQGRVPAAFPGEIEELIRRTDGIARMLSGKVTAMQARLDALEDRDAVPALDFGGTVSAYQIIEMAGVPLEDRQRGTAQMVTRRLIAFCAERQVACVRTPAAVNPSRPMRFPQPVAGQWLLGESRGVELIRGQVARMKARKTGLRRGSGQAALQLVSPAPRTEG